MSILEFEDVSYRYPGQETLALQGFTLALPKGERIAFVGRNGSGKSTVFLHCNGLYRPESGVVRFDGSAIKHDRKSLRWLRQRVGIVFQNPDDQLFSASVGQDISFGPLNLGLDETEARHRVQMAAEMCEISHLLERPTHALSGGEKARVALAGVLAMDPDVLVADEVLSNVDPWVRLSILDILFRLHRQGKTLILATHNLEIAQSWASFVVVMNKGQAAFAGTLKDLLASDTLMAQTGLSEVWRPQSKGSVPGGYEWAKVEE
jgi:cobalt/nickel transport system ATP-binding protein